jgi:hypothetical protein
MINVKVFPNSNVRHLDEIYAGLWELHHEKKIRLGYLVDDPLCLNIPNLCFNQSSFLLATVIDSSKNVKRKICFDMSDGPNFNFHLLNACDCYFKRSFYSKCVNNLEPSLKPKVLPYGLNYRCSSRNEKEMPLKSFIYCRVTGKIKKRPLWSILNICRSNLKQLFFSFCPAKTARESIFISEFESSPETEVEPLILFQVKIYDPLMLSGRSPEEFEEVMNFRANVVRALKNAFGKQFIGGLLPSPYSLKHYPDCLSSLPGDRRSYLKLVKRCLIAVMTTGLHDSIGGKLSEYLASSKCVVSEQLRYELPKPLVAQENFLPFTTPDECVKACQKILNDPAFATEMRRANFRYYLNEVRPTQKIWSCIQRSIAAPTFRN